MNYLLSPTTTIMRDIYQRFKKTEPAQRTLIALQKILVTLLGVIAFFLAIGLKSVLGMAIFAYTIYGVAITPALIAALAWKRATKVGGLVSIISGTAVCIFLRILVEFLPPDKVIQEDPWGIPMIFPGLIVSIGTLIIVSLLTKKPKPEELEKFFPEKNKAQT